jgi:hypothetical protein
VDWKPIVVGAGLGAAAVIAFQQTVQRQYLPRERGSVQYGNYPGWGGGRTSERFLADKAKDAVIRGKNDPRVRLIAIRIIQEAGLDGRQREEVAAAIQQWVRTNITYVYDPVRTEVFQEAAYTLIESKAGDCDDQAIAMAALLMSVGINAKLMLLSLESPFDPKKSPFTHIFSAIDTVDGQEIWLETIVPNKGLDYRHFHTATMRVDLTPGKPAEKKIEIEPNGGSGEKTPMPGFSGMDVLSGLA